MGVLPDFVTRSFLRKLAVLSFVVGVVGALRGAGAESLIVFVGALVAWGLAWKRERFNV